MKLDAHEKDLLESVEQVLLVSIKFHRRRPHRGIASWPSGSG